jgi:hypothetical protein
MGMQISGPDADGGSAADQPHWVLPATIRKPGLPAQQISSNRMTFRLVVASRTPRFRPIPQPSKQDTADRKQTRGKSPLLHQSAASTA